MAEENLFADDLWSLLLSPISWLWFIVPSCVRDFIRGLGRKTLLGIAKIVWVVLFWWFIWSLLSQYIPDCSGWVSQWYAYFLFKAGAFRVVVRDALWTNPVGLIFGLYSSVLGSVAFFLRRPPTVQPGFTSDYLSSVISKFTPERAMAGSELIPSKHLPDFCCFIFTVKNGERSDFLGMGFRAENAILTACHVLQGGDRFELVSNLGSMQVDESVIRVFPYDDVAYFHLTERDFSILGMSKGSLLSHAVPDGTGVYAQCYGPGNPVSFTMGSVQSATNFGKVTYSGTTGRGFSGSPYIVHKQVVGMHIGAGVVNLGVDAAYLRMLLTGVKESTEEWLIDELERDMASKKSVDWKRSPGNPDDIIVKRHGKYFVMDSDDFFSVYQEHSAIERGHGLTSKLVYDDTKNESVAPGSSGASAGASGRTLEKQYSVAIPLGPPANPILEPTKPLVASSDMGLPGQTLAQLRLASDTMSRDVSYEPERRQNQRRQRRKLRRSSPQPAINPGQQELDLIR